MPTDPTDVGLVAELRGIRSGCELRVQIFACHCQCNGPLLSCCLELRGIRSGCELRVQIFACHCQCNGPLLSCCLELRLCVSDIAGEGESLRSAHKQLKKI